LFQSFFPVNLNHALAVITLESLRRPPLNPPVLRFQTNEASWTATKAPTHPSPCVAAICWLARSHELWLSKGDWLMKRLAAGLMALILFGGAAKADFIIAHQGDTDPLTEGFTTISANTPSTFGPISNDMGLAAWRITGGDRSSQFGYTSGMLSASQKADIAAQGFTLTMVARVLQLQAPAYDGINHIVIGGADLDTGARRFEVDLGINMNGDTVVVLPTSVDAGGPGGSIRTPGPSFTLTGSGSSYHDYELVYDPTTQLADLFVDGVDRIQGYAGHTSFVGDRGLVWGAFSGGQGNFNLVQVDSSTSVPEPRSVALVVVGVGFVGATRLRRTRKARQTRA
jgi:hypothetical protein